MIIFYISFIYFFSSLHILFYEPVFFLTIRLIFKLKNNNNNNNNNNDCIILYALFSH